MVSLRPPAPIILLCLLRLHLLILLPSMVGTRLVLAVLRLLLVVLIPLQLFKLLRLILMLIANGLMLQQIQSPCIHSGTTMLSHYRPSLGLALLVVGAQAAPPPLSPTHLELLSRQLLILHFMVSV